MVSSVTLWSRKHRMTHSENCSTVQDTIRHAWIFAIDEEGDWREKRKNQEMDIFFLM